MGWFSEAAEALPQVENYGARKEARTNEIEGLKNAKAVPARGAAHARVRNV